MADETPEQIAERRIEKAARTGATELTLRGSNLRELPESLGRLTQLQTLDLSGNQLTALPESIGRLTQLVELHLHENQLTTLPGSIGRLTQLRDLRVDNNQLTALPESIGRLTRLQLLDLSASQVTALPGSIGQLTQLKELYLDNNQLTSLPESMQKLIHLDRLFLHGNGALGTPPEILGPTWQQVLRQEVKPANPVEILQYYFRGRVEATRPLNEAKILLVGQGGVGKTSLVKRLVENTFDPEERKTEGINITQWPIPVQSEGAEGNIRLNIWDFGGQEIMHATHQFFLTKRSLYLLVLDARKGENEGNIQYWLRIIQSYGADSPVLVVINKNEPPNQLDLNETRLGKDYAPYTALPGGIMPRLIVRMHRNLTKRRTTWQSGAVLEIEGCRALVRGDTQAGKVYISVQGEVPVRRRNALAVIRDQFRQIHGTIPKIGAQEKVPLPDNPDVVVGYEHLLTLEEQGIDSFVPEGVREPYRVQDLLNGIEDPEKRRQERERRGREGEWPQPSPKPEAEEAERRGPVDVRTFLVVGGIHLASFRSAERGLGWPGALVWQDDGLGDWDWRSRVRGASGCLYCAVYR